MGKVLKEPKGIYVGAFTEEQLEKGEDKALVAVKKAETGLKYVNTRIVKQKGELVLKIWVCSFDECEF